ncbi:MAG: nucleoside 2-deoxyribosyltransferase [Erysipelotrichaceae bacterium]|nr:nucleoside 2-deoxyribosyltransferase [Erysipelotrichaceae bacterium]
MKKGLVRIIALLLTVLTVISLTACAPAKDNTPEPAPQPEPSGQEYDGKRIYFAAPLFSDSERAYNLKIVAILESYGYEVFLPQRDGFLAPELEGYTEEEKLKVIFEKDRDEVLKADIVFVLLDGRVPDEGACVELGMAYAAVRDVTV